MNWAWATSLDQIWRSPAFPMWMTLAAAGFFGLILLITLSRADRSIANGALTVITLLSIAIAGAATMRVYGPSGAGRTDRGARAKQHRHREPAGSVLSRRSRRRYGRHWLREGPVRLAGCRGCGRLLYRGPDRPADRAR